MSSTMPSKPVEAEARGNAVEIAETSLFEDQPAAGLFGERRAGGNGVGIAVERQDTCGGVCENGPRVAAGAERGIEIEAGPRVERREDRVEKHGNVPGRSASGETLVIAAARCHSRAPRGRG